jgi:hypothetical protein
MLFKEPVKPHFMLACTIDFIAAVYNLPFLLMNHEQNLNSLMHTNEQLNFPNDFMQLIAFPCQMILTFIILCSSSLVGFASFLQ